MASTATQNAPALVEPQKRSKTIVDYLRDPKVIKGLEGVATQYLTAERMTRIAINAMQRVPKLKECTPQSVLGALMMSTAIGLEPNTVNQHAFLIPRDRRGKLENGQWGVIATDCQFMIGYRGYVVMAKRNPTLIKIFASMICENDVFEHMEGSQAFLKFAPAIRDRGQPIGAFCFTKEKGNFGEVDSATVMPWEEIEKIRAKSETFTTLTRQVNSGENQYQQTKAAKKLAETPWVMWESEMSAKSAIRRHIKQLDLTHGLNVISELDAGGDLGTIDMAALSDPDVAKAVADGEMPAPVVEHEEEGPRPDLAAARTAETRPAADAKKDAPAANDTAKPQTPTTGKKSDVDMFE